MIPVMDFTPRPTGHDQRPNGPRRVRVPGRDDIGEVVDEGMNFGRNPSIYCVGVHFPRTGECVYYAKTRITEINDQ